MRSLSRVVWSEGMYLGPHHFQAQSRYFEDSIDFSLANLWFEPNGFAACELDHEALKNGTVSLLAARGLFPDGLPFDMPGADAPPAPRAIAADFPPTLDSLLIYLAVPYRKPDGQNVLLDTTSANGPIRFSAASLTVPDETSGRDERHVQTGAKNCRFQLETESPEGFARLPVARVQRSGRGGFIYDPEFIPPCLRISASPRLMSLLGRLVEIMEEKSSTLMGSRRSTGWQTAFSQLDIASYWLLHSINSSLPVLRHLYFSKRAHAEELYLALARLAGALCSFSLNSHPRDLPAYDHRALDIVFTALDNQIRNQLELIIPTNCLTIPLKAGAEFFLEGPVSDDRCFARSQWILAIRASIGEAELITRTPQLIKVCSQQFVPQLVKRAMPGLTLTHLPAPPAAVSPRVETQYFSITKHGPCWDHLAQTRRVGVYVPAEVPGAQLEILVVLDS